MGNYVEDNKNAFIKYIESISEDRLPEEKRNKLIDWLENKSDFFVAPASTKYHSSFEGGLCLHSLYVYHILDELVKKYLPENLVSEDSIKIVSLFHDISKANYYEKYFRNVQNQNSTWSRVEEYRTKPAENRFIYGNHEQTSEFMIRVFIDLTIEESMAILHHHAGMGFDSSQMDISLVYEKSGLALLLHTADMIATYILENEKYNTINQ